jgi:hypothetical protein
VLAADAGRAMTRINGKMRTPSGRTAIVARI